MDFRCLAAVDWEVWGQGLLYSCEQMYKGCYSCLFRACINQHLMNNKDCFFCKATITGVDDYIKPATS